MSRKHRGNTRPHFTAWYLLDSPQLDLLFHSDISVSGIRYNFYYRVACGCSRAETKLKADVSHCSPLIGQKGDYLFPSPYVRNSKAQVVLEK